MKRISVDMGSGVTKIYIPGCGVVLREATCIAVEEYEEGGEKVLSVKAYGDKARAFGQGGGQYAHYKPRIRGRCSERGACLPSF